MSVRCHANNIWQLLLVRFFCLCLSFILYEIFSRYDDDVIRNIQLVNFSRVPS